MTAKTATKKKTVKKKAPKKKATKKKAAASKAPEQAPEQESNVVPFKGRTPSQKARSQQYIPGTEPARDPELTKLADGLYDIRSERMALTRREKEESDRLIDEMRAREIEEYVDPDVGIRIELKASKYKVRVRKFDPDEMDE